MGTWYCLRFADQAGASYGLTVTDLAFRYFVDREREAGRISGRGPAEALTQRLGRAEAVYLRVGLARHWDQFPDRCYLQVNGVYSFPDYLDGRCFADFAPKPSSRSNAMPTPAAGTWIDDDLADLPF